MGFPIAWDRFLSLFRASRIKKERRKGWRLLCRGEQVRMGVVAGVNPQAASSSGAWTRGRV